MKRFFVAVFALVSLLGFYATQARADLLVSDNFGNQILRYDQVTGAFLGVLVSSNPGLNGGLSGPVGMRIDGNGDLLVSSQNTNQLLKYNAMTGAYLGEFSGPGNGANFAQPADFQFGPGGNIYVANFGGASVDSVLANGTYVGPYTNGGPGIAGTSSFAFGPGGNLFVGSFGTGDIFEYDASGNYLSTFATGMPGASGLFFDGDGDLWVASLLTHQLFEYGSAGNLLQSFTTGANTFPSHIIVNPNDSNELLVALAGAGGIYRYSTTGNPLGAFATGGGLIVPGQMLLYSAAVPEPATFGVGLVAILVGMSKFRRRKT